MNSTEEIKPENNNINQNTGDTEEKEIALNKEEALEIEKIRMENRILFEEDTKEIPRCKIKSICSIF